MSGTAATPRGLFQIRLTTPRIGTQAEAAIETVSTALQRDRLTIDQIANLVARQPGCTGRIERSNGIVHATVVRFGDGSGVGVHPRGIDHLVPATRKRH